MNPNDYMTTEQAAIELNTTAMAVRKMIDRGKIAAVKVGRDWFIPISELEKVRERKRGRPKKTPLDKLSHI